MIEFKFLLFILISCLITFALAPFYISLLFKFNIRRISKPDLDDKLPERSVKLGTPIMGGFLIILPTIILMSIFLRGWIMYIPILLTLLFGGFLGFVDEFINTIGRRGFSFAVREAIDSVVSKNSLMWAIYKFMLIPWELFKELFRMLGSTQRGFKTHQKVVLQLLVALIGAGFLYFKVGLHTLWFPMLGEISLGILYIPFILFLCLAFANAFGVTDGMDGLSAGLHTVSFLTYGALAIILGMPEVAYFCAILVGAEIAFLYFNIHPARVEMSDVGTLPLGMVFVFLAALMQRELTLPIVGAVFTIELISSFVQVLSVKLRGTRVLLIAPIHHHFEKLGWGETKVTERFWLANGIFCVLGLLIALL